jgi:LCP family protein required for cell wall assembly
VLRRSVKFIAATVSFVLLIGSGLAWYNYRTLETSIKSIRVDGLGGAPRSAASNQGRPMNGKDENILIVGDDSRAGLSKAEGRRLSTGTGNQTTSTDTILLVHVPADGSRATLISIPRDSYVTIPGHPKNKINAAYADGYYYTNSATTADERQTAGADLLVATVKVLTGVTINHYVQIGFAGFEKVVRAINGITVNLCHAVDDTVAYNRAHNQTGGSGFVSSAGIHHLDAVRSLQFVRQRHNLPGIGDDLGREKRQRYFLSAAFDQILSAGVLLNPIKLNNIVKAIGQSFVKDDGFSLQSFARQMANLSGNKIGGQTIPTTTGPDVPRVGSVLYVNPAKVQRFVHDAFGGAARSTSAASSPRHKSASATASSTSRGTSKPTAGCID